MSIPHPSPEGVEKFKALWERHFGEPMPEGKALEMATRYLQFVFFGISLPSELGKPGFAPVQAAENHEVPQ